MTYFCHPRIRDVKEPIQRKGANLLLGGVQFYFAFFSCIYRLTCCFHEAVSRIQPGFCVCSPTAIWITIWCAREIQAHLCLFPSQRKEKVVTGSQAVISWGRWFGRANMPGSLSEENRFSPCLLLHLFAQKKWNSISKVCLQMKEICGLKRVPQLAVYSGFLVWLLVPWTLVYFSLL